MKLAAEDFIYPEHLPPAEVIRRIKTIFGLSDERERLLNEKDKFYNHLHREAWIYQVNPFWLLVSLQREQSLLGNDGRAATDRAWSHALGVVGQQTAGTVNETWDGFSTQITMAARTTTWLAGISPVGAMGNPKLIPSARRWGTVTQKLRGGISVDLLDLAGKPVGSKFCKTMESYVQTAYTPRADKDMEIENGLLAEQFVRPYWK